MDWQALAANIGSVMAYQIPVPVGLIFLLLVLVWRFTK
jgi:hypothetical protein